MSRRGTTDAATAWLASMNSTAPGSNSDSSFVNCAAAARVCAASADGGEACDGIVGPGEGSESRNRASSGSSAAATWRSRGFRFGSGGPIANELLQRAGGRLHRLGADVPGHALERVGETLRESRVALGQRGGDLLDRRSLLLRELAQEFQIEFPITRDASQAILRIEAFDLGVDPGQVSRTCLRPASGAAGGAPPGTVLQYRATVSNSTAGSIGLETWSFMPEARQRCRSSMVACAVMAMIGQVAQTARPREFWQ